MQVELIQPGSYCAAKIFLKNGEFVRAQSDAMVAMTSAIEVEGKAEGGIGGELVECLNVCSLAKVFLFRL